MFAVIVLVRLLRISLWVTALVLIVVVMASVVLAISMVVPGGLGL